MNFKTSIGLLLGLAVCLAGSSARADEADDLQLMIDRERRGVDDLRRLDEMRAAGEDIGLLEVWLNEAWKLRGDEEYDRAREVLDRVDAQKDMVREQITAARMKAAASKAEADLEKARARIKALEKELRELSKKKAGMNGGGEQ